MSKAAQELRVQQSTLSIAIRRLESMVGRTLLVRGRHGTTTTRSGQLFVVKAKDLVDRWKDLSQTKSSLDIRERFSLGCHQSTGIFTLRRFLPQLLAKYPSVEITVEHQYSHDVVEAVLRNQLDFAITVNPTRHQDLEIIELYPTYVALFSSEQTNRLNKNVLFFDPRMYCVEAVMAQLEKSKIRFGRKLPVASLETIASLVVSGAGRGILPADTACGQGGPLLQLLWEPKQLQALTVCLVCRRDTLASSLARVVQNAIQQGLKGVVPGRKYKKSALTFPRRRPGPLLVTSFCNLESDHSI